MSTILTCCSRFILGALGGSIVSVFPEGRVLVQLQVSLPSNVAKQVLQSGILVCRHMLYFAPYLFAKLAAQAEDGLRELRPCASLRTGSATKKMKENIVGVLDRQRKRIFARPLLAVILSILCIPCGLRLILAAQDWYPMNFSRIDLHPPCSESRANYVGKVPQCDV